MPLPMVHLAVAVRLVVAREPTGSPESADTPESTDSAEFYLGSIAPDAIHTRDGAGRSEKLDTHFAHGYPRQYDLGALGAMLAEHRVGGELVSFAEGYAAHVLTDRLWQDTLVAAFRQRMQREGAELDLRALYYRDCDKLDFDIYDTAPWRSAVWGYLSAAAVCDFSPFLTASEIAAWRDRVLGWFDQNPAMRLHEATQISSSEVEAFIHRAAGEVAGQMREWRRG